MQRLEDGFDDTVRSSQHITIPESQDSKTFAPQEGISIEVLRSPVEVLAAIQFDNDPSFEADEVTDVDANWMLAPEFVAA